MMSAGVTVRCRSGAAGLQRDLAQGRIRINFLLYVHNVQAFFQNCVVFFSASIDVFLIARAQSKTPGSYTLYRLSGSAPGRHTPPGKTGSFMDIYVIWFIAAGALVAVELLSGSFYLLMIALGVAAGGVASLAGLAMVWQFLVAALVAVAGILALRRRGLRPHVPGESSNLVFDVGQAVEVVERRPDGSLRVFYRGTHWDAEIEPGTGASDAAASYVIKATRGSRLILTARA